MKMAMVRWIFNGLASLVLSQLVDHKDEIKDLLSKFLSSLIEGLLKNGDDDVVHKIQSVVSDHLK
jgi:hypothetical protein